MLVVQLARNAGARVIGLSSEKHTDWLRAHGAIPGAYGDGADMPIAFALRLEGA